MWVEKNGPTYRIRDEVGGKKVTLGSGYPTRKSAENIMVQLRADQLRGEALVPRGGRVELGEWLDLWWPGYEVRLKPSSRVSAEGLVRRYIRPMLGHLTLDDLDPLTVRRWTADMLAGRTPRGRPLAPKTVRNAHGLLHKVLQDAVWQRLIRSNPCIRTGLPQLPQDEMRFLTEPEAQRLLAAVPDRWRPLVLLMLFTGLRWGEAAGLRVGRLDILARKLTVVETQQELAGTGEIVYVTPKSRGSRRTVTFPMRVADALIELVAARGRDEVVFTAPAGGPLRYRNFRSRVWLPAIRAAGLEGLRLHDLRHSHVAWLISAGRPLTAISRRLGHASITITSDRYGHLMPEVDVGMMSALDEALDKIEDRGDVGGTGPEVTRTEPNRTEESPGQRG